MVRSTITRTVRTNKLYVFLHGLTVVRPIANEIEVVLPKISGHLYKAGSWLAEGHIPEKSILRLRGVAGGSAPFPWDGMIHLQGTSMTQRKRAATLVLPQPQTVLGLLLANPTPPPFPPTTTPVVQDYVAITNDGKTKFQSLANPHVLIYTYRDENEVFLDGHYWEPYSTGGAISLHIISTSEMPEGAQHELETHYVLGQVMDRYPGLSFKKTPRPIIAPWIDPQPLLPLEYAKGGNFSPLHDQGEHFFEKIGSEFAYAFAKAELQHPTLRAVTLANLARLKREQRPTESLWVDPEPLCDTLSNCSTTGTN